MDINVFELAFKENAALSKAPVKPVKKVMESVTKGIMKSALKKEAVQLSKLRFTEDKEELSTVQPEDDIVVVYSDDIKPDMTEEEVAQAAEELIGATICKCGVCGANYIAGDAHAHEDEIIVDDEANTDEVPDEFTFTDEDSETLDDIEFADEGLGESLLFREEVEDDSDTEPTEPVHTCPVCDATESQVEVGEIVPTETATESDESEETETEEVPADVDNSEVTAEDETEDAPVKVDVDVNVASDDDIKPSRESLRRARNEGISKNRKSKPGNRSKSVKTSNEGIFGSFGKENHGTEEFKSATELKRGDMLVGNSDELFKVLAVTPNADDKGSTKIKYKDRLTTGTLTVPAGDTVKVYVPSNKVPTYKAPVGEGKVNSTSKISEVAFNERAFTRLLNQFVAENYNNVKSVTITTGKSTKKGELQFEGIVTAKSGKTRKIVFETVGFKYNDGTTKLKMIEKGPFTESAKVQKNAVPFVLECHCRAGRIMPTVLKYRYAVKVKNEWFECTGKHTISEGRKTASKTK